MGSRVSRSKGWNFLRANGPVSQHSPAPLPKSETSWPNRPPPLTVAEVGGITVALAEAFIDAEPRRQFEILRQSKILMD